MSTPLPVREEPIRITVTRLSNSSVEAARNCPFFYLNKHVRELPCLETPAAETGNVFHDIAEEYLHHLQDNNRDGDIEECEAIGEKWLITAGDETRAEIWPMVEYLRDTFRVNPAQIAGIEWELAMDWDGEPIPYEEKRGFRGKLDLVLMDEYSATIVDFKTGRKPPNQKALASDQQLARYARLLLAHYPGLTVINLRLVYVRLQRTYDVKFERDKVMRETLQNVLEEKRKLEERTEWEATPGDQCIFCSFQCPHKGTPAEPLVPKTHVDAVQVAQEIVAFESAINARFKFLQDYCTEYEPQLEAGGRYWSIESTDNPFYVFKSVLDAAKELKLNTDKLMRPETDGKIVGFVATNPPLRAKLGEPLRKYGQPIFNGRKTRPDSWGPVDTSISRHKGGLTDDRED